MALEQAGLQLIAQGVAGYVGDLQKADKATESVGASAMKAAGLAQDAAGRWRTATGQFASDAEKAAAGVAPLGGAAQKVADTAEKSGQEVENSGKHFTAFKEFVVGALREAGAMALRFGVQAGQAIAGFVKDSISVAGDFEAGMHKFQAVAGNAVDTKGLEKFKDLFISLGKELPVSTSEVEQAAIEMVSGGIDPAIVAGGALRQTIQFAAAAGLSLADAAGTSAKFLAGWTSASATTAEKVDFLTQSTDALTKAAAASSTTAAELRLGIFNVQGAAQALHAPFTDVVATLAELAPAFESSAQAGTALNVFMTRLVPQTDKAHDAMAALGLITKTGQNVFFDTQGNFLGMANAAEQLKDKLGGLTAEQKIEELHLLFGNDAMKVGNLLMVDGAAGLEAMKAKMEAANGVASTAALVQSGYNTALENAKGSVEALQIRIGGFLLPVLTDLLNNYIAPGVNAITSFSEAFIKMAPAIEASDDPLQTFLNALKIAAPGLLDIITQVENAKDAFLAFVIPIEANVMPAMQQLASFIGDNLKPILFGIATAIAVAVVPALLAAGAAFVAAAAPVIALVAAGALLYSAWTSDFLGIRTTVTAWWTDTLEPIFEQVYQWLAKEIPVAVATMSAFWTDTLLPALKKVGAFFDNVIFPVLGDLADVWIAIAIKEIGLLEAIWSNVLWPALKLVGSYIGNVLIPIFSGLFEVAWAIAMKAGEALAGLWQKVIAPALRTVGDYINTTVIPAFQGIGSYLSATFGPILTEVGKWLDTVTGGFGGVTGAVQSAVEWLGNLADSISKLKLPDWLTPGSPTPLELGLLGIGKAIQGVVPGLSAMGAGMKEVGTQITDAFVNTDIVDMLESLGKDAMAGFGEGLKAGLNGVKSIINSTANSVEDAFNSAFDSASPSKRMIPSGQWIIQGVVVGMQDEIPVLTAFVSQFGNDLANQMQDIADQIQGIIADSFGATASIDRQLAANLDKMKDVLPQYQQFTQGALDAAQAQAQQFADPAQGAKYFAMRSKQILEYAKLQKDLDEAETQADKDRIAQQMLLINAAQTAELSAFNANQAAATSPQAAIAAQINDILKALADPKLKLTDDQIHMVDMLSGILASLGGPPAPARAAGGPVDAGKPYWVGEQGKELFVPDMAGKIMSNLASRQSQPMSAGSMARAGNSMTIGHQGTVVNMPVYTNQSPSVLRDSMAIAGAALL